jgi:hypothetical protein
MGFRKPLIEEFLKLKTEYLTTHNNRNNGLRNLCTGCEVEEWIWFYWQSGRTSGVLEGLSC